MATSTKRTDALTWYIRSTLNESATLGVIADVSTLAAFSPDIIPLDQTQASPSELAACYKHFVAHTIDRDEEITFIHIRAKVSPPPQGHLGSFAESCQVDLHAVPNELVLWPDLWEREAALGHTNLDSVNSKAQRNVVVGDPISYKHIQLPDNSQHSHETLVAIRTSSNTHYQPLASNVKNWRDLVTYVGKNDAFSFYNAMGADLRPEKVVLTTKLRMLENEKPFVDLYLGLEAVGTPTEGVVASLHISDGASTSHTIGPKPLLPLKDFGEIIQLPANFSGTVTLEVVNNNKEVFDDYSSISVVLYGVDNLASGASNHVLIGADHVFFDANPRVKRLVRKYKPSSFRVGITADVEDTPEFYFRGQLGDTSLYPRQGDPNMSPDIQPVGNYAVSDPINTFSNQLYDYSTNNNTAIVSDQSNYVYVSGHATSPHKGDLRLYIIPSTILLLPSQYNTPECVVTDIDTGDENVPITAIRSYHSESNDTQLIVTTEPFLIDDPKNPDVYNSDHYCLVAECKPHRTPEEVKEQIPPYKWPHEELEDYVSIQEFSAWVLNEPRVAWRNMGFTDGAGEASDYSVRQSFKLKGVNPSQLFQYKVSAINCPIGSQFSMDSTDSEINFARTTVTNDNEGGVCEFSGKSDGFSCQTVVRWYANGHAKNYGQKVFGQLSHYGNGTSNLAKSSPKTVAQNIANELKTPNLRKKKLYVGESYPNVIAPRTSRVPGRLRIGGAIRARRLTSSRKCKNRNIDVEAEYDSGSDGSEYSKTTGTSGGLGGLTLFLVGADTAQQY